MYALDKRRKVWMESKAKSVLGKERKMHKGNTHQPKIHVLDRKSSTIPKVPVPRNMVSNAFDIENLPHVNPYPGGIHWKYRMR
jgi:hypothetical protein